LSIDGDQIVAILAGDRSDGVIAMQKISIGNLVRRLLAALLARRHEAPAGCLPADPFDHPALQAMDLRALADLPFERQAWRG